MSKKRTKVNIITITITTWVTRTTSPAFFTSSSA
jgi:hypothetical protein